MASFGIPCVVYAAKSTEDRRGSIPDQLRECREAIGRGGGRRVVGEYTDEAFSAFKRSRGPGLVDAMQHVEDLTAEFGSAELWAQHSDRLARGDGRSARHAVEIGLWALKRDITVHTLQDPDTFRDLLYAVVTGQRNHEDSRRKAQAMMGGRRRAAARGDFIGYRPDGYKLAVDINDHGCIKKRMVIDPERSEVIEMIFRLALRGRSTGAIARSLNHAGWRTNPRRKDQVPMTWTGERVALVLRNPRYAAVSVFGGEVVARGHWPAYITERQHQRILARIARPDRRTTKPHRRETYLLARLMKCGRCGAPVHCVTGVPGRDGVFARRYVCSSHLKDRGKHRCGAPRMGAEMVEAMFVASLRNLLIDGLDEEVEPRTVLDLSQDYHWLRDLAIADDDVAFATAVERLLLRIGGQTDHASITRRRARRLETVKRFETWAREELAGRTEASRAEAPTLNRLLHTWFSRVTVTLDDRSVDIVARHHSSEGEPAFVGEARARFDRADWTRVACLVGRPRLRRAWNDFEILGALQAWAEVHGRSPTSNDWVKAEANRPVRTVVHHRFGDWNRALRRAGLKPYVPARRSRSNPWSRKEVVAALRRWRSEHGRAPKLEEWLVAGDERPCATTVLRHLGGWSAAIKAAGLKAERPRAPSNHLPWTDDGVIEALQHWAAEHGRAPLAREWLWAVEGRPTVKTVRAHFGGWPAGLSAAGLA